MLDTLWQILQDARMMPLAKSPTFEWHSGRGLETFIDECRLTRITEHILNIHYYILISRKCARLMDAIQTKERVINWLCKVANIWKISHDYCKIIPHHWCISGTRSHFSSCITSANSNRLYFAIFTNHVKVKNKVRYILDRTEKKNIEKIGRLKCTMLITGYSSEYNKHLRTLESSS